MKIAILGFGRFGQLWAQIMKPFSEIIIFSDGDKRDLAQEMGCEFYNLSEIEKISMADWIFLGVPISATQATIKKIAPFVSPNTLVMDLCSVKSLPCKWLTENILEPTQIMGIHPMFGPDSARTGLNGKQVVICPLRISDANLEKVKAIFNQLELKIIQVTPEEHDQQSAYSLALVHFLGRTLDEMHLEQISITTLGFERLMKIRETVSNDSWQLFQDLENANPYAKEVRQELMQKMIAIENTLLKEEEKNHESNTGTH